MATAKKSTSRAKKSALVTVNKVALSAEREQQLAEWQQREAADKAILMDWGQRLQKTHKQVSKLNNQYRDLIYGFMQEAYVVYK